MINNRFIGQLEEEIAKQFPKTYVLETKERALHFNSFEKDYLMRVENEAYINRLTKSYLSR